MRSSAAWTTAIDQGIRLDGPSRRLASGRLFLQTEAIAGDLPAGLPTAKADNQILAVVIHLQRRHPERPVILVSKDINMRIKARALGLQAQDYFNDKVLEDSDLLYTGMRELTTDFWDHYASGHRVPEKGRAHAVPPERTPVRNCWSTSIFYQEGGKTLHAIVRAISGDDGRNRDADRLHASQEQRLGNHGAQPRAELRIQSADESGD
jgi:PhoH-like ATPase